MDIESMLAVICGIYIALLIVFFYVMVKSVRIIKQTIIRQKEAFSTKNAKFFISGKRSYKYKRSDMLMVGGAVGNEPINKGDVFRLFDRSDNVIDNNVIVEQISKGFSTKLDSVPAESKNVGLVLRSQTQTQINKPLIFGYLKK